MKFDYEIEKFINKRYSYGFKIKIKTETIAKGLNEKIIKSISKKKKEPLFMYSFRLNAFNKWKKLHEPKWAYLKYKKINYQNIRYYSAPNINLKKLTKINSKLVYAFEKLGIPFFKQIKISNVAIDIVFDSISISMTYKAKLAKFGVIFCSITEAILLYPELIKSYLGIVVPFTDNFFAALNSAVFTDGSFCFIPKNTKCPLELSTYFRLNEKESGQFERTLIIAEDNSEINYIEGCTAPKYDNIQLHTAIVELIVLSNAYIKYMTVQNWYSGDEFGNGGIYNFVTKRGLCAGINSKISWTQVETGSSVTWKYPSCILLGPFSKGEFYSVTLTTNFQQADTGTKMIHVSKKTRSRIISKGISSNKSKNTYRGFVKIGLRASQSQNFSQCDSLIIGINSFSNTFPYIFSKNSTSKVEHEAYISKIGEEQIFYCQQRGIDVEQAISLIINGFCREIITKLPMEFSLEASRLLKLKLKGTVG